jgi:hypothetical protein
MLAHILLSALVVFVFAVSVVGVMLGLALMLRTSAALRFIARMNRWVSTAQALKPLEAPVHIAPRASGRRWLGAALLLLGAYAAVVLIATFDVERLALLFKFDPRHSVASVGLEALKWILVVGSLSAIAVGFLLAFFPALWRAIEERANRWYSTPRLERADHTVYLPLERVVEAYPRAAGSVIFALSLAAAAASGVLILARR